MNIRLCIESNGDAALLEQTIASIGRSEVSYTLYSADNAGVVGLWHQLGSSARGDEFLLFIKEGDLLCEIDKLLSLAPSADLYLLYKQGGGRYPKVHVSPFSMSCFYRGLYNNYHFLFSSKWCRLLSPDMSYGRSWLINIIMYLLYKQNVDADSIALDVLRQGSPSIAQPIGDNDIRLKIIPSQYGNLQSDMTLIDYTGADRKYRRKSMKRIRGLKLNLCTLAYKRLFNARKYRQFFRTAIFRSKYTDNWSQIPIIINNFNRLDYLLRLISSLEVRGVTNIHILDNNSTYPPLLEYYKTTPYSVHLLGENLGYRALWKSSVYDLFKDDYYVYTDPDLEICEYCPADFMSHFMSLHQRYSMVWKVGFSLVIDDLPTCFVKHREVKQWERQFQELELEPNVYYAPIDTTFAIYKPFGISVNERSLRVGGFCAMRHLPWYIDSENISTEERYYVENCKTRTHWSVFK